MENLDKELIKNSVRENYSKVAQLNILSQKSNCCESSLTTPDIFKQSEKMGYSNFDLSAVPEGSNMGLGCGNPQAIANLKHGETVLDLGSGGGFDCFLAAKQVGETGKVVGVDMTSDMISLARKNAVNGKYSNVEFRLGEIEHLPVADSTIDVIISNCVINLSTDKKQVFEECFRVLKSGGRLAISDMVLINNIPEKFKNDLSLYSCCVTGAIDIDSLSEIIQSAGFVDVKIRPKEESKEFIKDWVQGTDISEYVISANIEAVKS